MKKINDKLKLWILFLVFLSITAYLISSSYALFETDASGDKEIDIGKWIIKLNDIDISTGTSNTFTVDSFTYTPNTHIKNGYIAPGRSGYFDIILDPAGTEVSVRYDVTLSPATELEDNILYSVTTSNGDIVMTGPNTYSGVFSISQIENEETLVLRINLDWTNDVDYNETDTELGLVWENSISVPVEVYVAQYLGETLVEYSG